MSETLNTVVVLLYDVVGSTRLRADLGDSEAERLFRSLDEEVAGIAEAAGGTVIKGTGDGQYVVFPSAGAALGAAGTIQRAARGVTLRMAVSAGDIRRDARDIYGTPAVEAARLVDAAGDGQVLVADVVRTLAGSWQQHPLRDAGLLELKGLAEPLRAWSLEWSTPPAHESALLVDDEFPFVGRDQELERLRKAWWAAMSGEIQMICLAGEPGVGKTRLAVEFAQLIPDASAVLAGRCERGAPAPLGPFVEALGTHARRTDLDELEAATVGAADTLARYVPEIGERLGVAPATPLDDAALESHRFNESVIAMLDAISRRSPVLIILDDIQWADEATRRLLSKLARRPVSMPMLLIATVRDTSDDLTPEVAEWLRSVLSGARASEVTVTDLTRSDVEHLAIAVLGDRGRDVAGTVYGQAGGHGFFTAEILRQLVAGNDAETMPRSIAELIRERLNHLSPDVAILLGTAALVGLAFDFTVVTTAAGLSEGRGLEAIESALGARLVLEDGADRFQFTHALVPAALAEEISASRRVRLHRAIADTLAASGAPAPDVARHLVGAVPLVDAARAREAAVAAAERAAAGWRFDHAASLFGLALEVPASERETTELLLRQGTAWNDNGSASFGVPMFRHAFELAERNGWWDLMAKAALGIWGDDPWRDNRSTEAVELLGRAAEQLEEVPTGIAAEVLAQQASFSILTQPLSRRRELADRAWSMVQSVDDPLARYGVLHSRWVAIACPQTLDLLPEMDAELARLGASLPGRLETGAAAPEVACTWMGDGERLRAISDHLESERRPMRDIDLWRIHSLGASIALAEGRTDEARRLADLAFDEGRDAWNDTAVGIHTHVMSSADRIDGQPERARDRLTALEEAVGGPVLRLLVAWVDAEAGHADRAAGALGRIGVDRIRALPELFLGTIGLAAAAGTACALRDRSWMRVVYETMLPLEEQICGLPWAPLPAAAHFLGQLAAGLGDPSAADRHHDIAELVHGRFLAPGFSAYAEEHRSSARA